MAGHARVYTPPTASIWKAQIVICYEAAGGPAPLTGPVRVQLYFQMPRPKGHFGTGRNRERLKDSAPTHHTKKPDLDNLAKAVLDALKGHAWVDDSQVCVLEKRKQYAAGPIGCAITIEPIEDY